MEKIGYKKGLCRLLICALELCCVCRGAFQNLWLFLLAWLCDVFGQSFLEWAQTLM